MLKKNLIVCKKKIYNVFSEEEKPNVENSRVFDQSENEILGQQKMEILENGNSIVLLTNYKRGTKIYKIYVPKYSFALPKPGGGPVGFYVFEEDNEAQLTECEEECLLNEMLSQMEKDKKYFNS